MAQQGKISGWTIFFILIILGAIIGAFQKCGGEEKKEPIPVKTQIKVDDPQIVCENNYTKFMVPKGWIVARNAQDNYYSLEASSPDKQTSIICSIVVDSLFSLTYQDSVNLILENLQEQNIPISAQNGRSVVYNNQSYDYYGVQDQEYIWGVLMAKKVDKMHFYAVTVTDPLKTGLPKKIMETMVLK